MYKKIPYYIIDSINSNKTYKIFAWVLLIVSVFFTVKRYININIFESIGLIITDFYFLSLFYFEFSFIITKKICNEYNQNNYLKLRLKSRNDMNKQINKSNIYCQTIFFALIIALIFIMLNIFSRGSYSIIYLKKYGINSVSFCIYSLLKIYFFTILLSVINTTLIEYNLNNFTYIVNILFCFLLLVYSFIANDITTEITCFIGSSLINTFSYTKYYYNICNYLFHMLLLLIMLVVLRVKLKNEVYNI